MDELVLRALPVCSETAIWVQALRWDGLAVDRRRSLPRCSEADSRCAAELWRREEEDIFLREDDDDILESLALWFLEDTSCELVSSRRLLVDNRSAAEDLRLDCLPLLLLWLLLPLV